MRFEVCLITDIGCQRKNNEDGFYINNMGAFNIENSFLYEKIESPFITFVADGVGGSQQGEEATQLCIKTAMSSCVPEDDNELIQLIDRMNKTVCETRKNIDTACTLAGLLVGDDSIHLFDVGDSKVFSLNQGYLNQLSVDDTAAGISGEYTTEKQPLLQYMGKANCFPHLTEINPSSMFLICSDGLTDMVSIDEIEETVKETKGNVKATALQLVHKAKENGGLDNITVIILSPVKED